MHNNLSMLKLVQVVKRMVQTTIQHYIQIILSLVFMLKMKNLYHLQMNLIKLKIKKFVDVIKGMNFRLS